MTQDKMRRIITACVSAATALLVLLLSFLIYQWITIATLNKKIDKAKQEVAYWTQQLADAESDVETLLSKEYLQNAIFKLNLLQGK